MDTIVTADQKGNVQLQEEHLRTEGKGLAEFAKQLIQKKRRRIDLALKRVLTIPFASITILIALALVIFRFVTTGILKPPPLSSC